MELLCGNPEPVLPYPGGTYDKNLMRQLTDWHSIHVRSLQQETLHCGKFFEWHPSCRDSDPNALDLAKRLVKEDAPECRLLFIWGHSFEFDKTDFDSLELYGTDLVKP